MKAFAAVLFGAALYSLQSGANHSLAQSWVQTSAPITNWSSIACSADGTKLIAAVSGGLLYTSTNSGSSWTPTAAGVTNWASVASSANGKILFAVGGQGPIYISTNAGSSWLPVLDSPEIIGEWKSLVCSADGNLVLAGSAWLAGYAYGGQISISTNRGATWATTFAGGYLTAVDCSSDGRVMLVGRDAANPADLSISTNWGENWFSVPVRAAYSIGASADGTRLIANNGRSNPQQPVNLSTNSGSTWSQIEDPTVRGTRVAISGDGKTMVACANSPGAIFLSHDSGVTWVMSSFPNLNWADVCSSADGSALVAAANAGPIYRLRASPKPLLNTSLSAGTLLVSWTVPSADFVLQQTSSMATPIWWDVPTPATLNYSNLNYEVLVPAQAGSVFYRLVSR